ncbi:MAG: hypothetical protein ICV64_09030 [Thermoleophilia bacterium]|nr:hypothetical protein [Thermoleophilia bacterium]
MSGDERARRLAFNESLVREVNEAVVGLAEGWFQADEPVEFRCECVRPDCPEILQLTVAEYGEVRRAATRFAVAPGHADPSVERVVGEVRGAHVVEKLGAGRQVAEETDPRGPGAG